MATELRRDSQRVRCPDKDEPSDRDMEFCAQTLTESADTWAGVAAKTSFLLGRFARTAERQDDQMQKLIQRALSDCARLIKREERKR